MTEYSSAAKCVSGQKLNSNFPAAFWNQVNPISCKKIHSISPWAISHTAYIKPKIFSTPIITLIKERKEKSWRQYRAQHTDSAMKLAQQKGLWKKKILAHTCNAIFLPTPLFFFSLSCNTSSHACRTLCTWNHSFYPTSVVKYTTRFFEVWAWAKFRIYI